MKTDLERIRVEVLELIRESTPVQERKLRKIRETEKRLEAIKKERGIDFEVFLGGSYAKGTDIRGSDIDIFLLFSGEFDPLGIIKILKEEFPNGREEYSEHPYLLLPQDSFSIDIVPGYSASTVRDLKTSVDRTPFHVKFVVSEFSTEMKEEVRILKQFLKGISVYGAESSKQGFSGYVSELLIFHYKTFAGLIDSARNWNIPLSLEGTGQKFKEANLVIIDPVDSERNAAANVSKENLATFILAAKFFSWEKWRDFFFSVSDSFSIPGNATAIYLPCKKCNERVLVPNLRRIASVLKGELENYGFRIQYSSVFVHKGGYIIMVPEAEALGDSELHIGPPIENGNVSFFLEKWGRGTKFGMPFVVGDRICVLRERRERNVSGAIAEILPRIKLAKDFDPKKSLVISGKDLISIPREIREHFLNPSLGKWILSSSGNVERDSPEP